MPTTRKPVAKKQTPAAAKKSTTRRKTTPRKKPEPVQVQAPSVHVITEEQKQAKLEAYHALTSVGLEVPRDLAEEVEGWIANLNAQKEAEAETRAQENAAHEARVAEANQNGPWYVRNGYPAPFNLRLDRQTEKRRIELKARGTPGDMHPLKDEDLKDPVLKQNLALGLIEIIPAGEATLIIDKQTTNMSHRVHAPLAVLRNELGQTYEQGAVKVEAEFNSQGVTVARVNPDVLTGKLHDREIGGTRSSGGLTRVQPGQEVAQGGNQTDQASSVVQSGFVPTGGNSAIVQYGPLGDNARAKVADDLARRKGGQGPQSGLGDVTVTVDPVVRT